MRTPTTALLPFLLIAGVMFSGASPAHQATAMFDSSRKMTLRGTVQQFTFTNPHSLLYLTAVDDKGVESVWVLEGGATSKMARNGWNYQSVKPGDRISVLVSPRIDGTNRGSFSVMIRKGDAAPPSSPTS